MLKLLPTIIPPTSLARPVAKGIHFSPVLAEVAGLEKPQVFAGMKTAPEGLSEEEAASRFAEVGPNFVAGGYHHGWRWRVLRAVRNPLVILLSLLATISFVTGDARAGTVMTLMVILGVVLRLVQETKADAAAEKLKAMIKVTAAVVRGGREEEIALQQLVPGDVVRLSAGDMIPADVRLVASKDLFITQAALTGESLPVEKHDAPETRAGIAPLEFANTCFLGTSVESGTASAVILATGAQTYFGSMAGSMSGAPVQTSFDRGLKDFTWLMIRFIMVMVPLVFLINGLTKHNWHEAFFFSIAVAVGLTPEMLPMIVSVCLSKGALAMSRKKVIVKQLSAIQNFGAMDVLCTDKTGTLTMDQVVLEKYCDVMQKENAAGPARRLSHLAFSDRVKKRARSRSPRASRHARRSNHRLSQGGRDSVRFRAPHDVGGSGDTRRGAPAPDQGGAGGDFCEMQFLRTGRRDFPDGADPRRRLDRAVSGAKRGWLSRARRRAQAYRQRRSADQQG